MTSSTDASTSELPFAAACTRGVRRARLWRGLRPKLGDPSLLRNRDPVGERPHDGIAHAGAERRANLGRTPGAARRAEHLQVVRFDLSDGAVIDPPYERLEVFAIHGNSGRLSAPSFEVRVECRE